MGIYSSVILNEEFEGEEIDIPELEDEVVEESVHEPNVRGAYAIIAENEMNYANIMKAVGIDEIRAYTGHITEAEEEKSTSGFFEKAKQMIITAGKKILELIKRFGAAIESRIRSNAGFADKIATRLKDSDVANIKEIKGYIYTPHKISIANARSHGMSYISGKMSAKDVAGMESQSAELKNNRANILSELRGKCVRQGSMDKQEFDKVVFKMLRNGASEKQNIKSAIKVSAIVEILKGYKESKSAMKEDAKTVKGVIKDMISDIEKMKSEVKKGDDAGKMKRFYSDKISLYKDLKSIITAVSGARLSALAKNYSQARSIAVLLSGVAVKDKSDKKEKAVGESFIDSIELV